MDDRGSRQALTDDAALDRELERALAVDPSPVFLARVRTRIAAEPAPSAWLFNWMLWVAAGTAMAIVIAVASWRQPGLPGGPRGSIRTIVATPVAAPFVSLLPGVVASQALAASQNAPSPGGASVTHAAGIGPAATERHVQEPEVLIAADEAAALRRLIRGAPRGPVDVPALENRPTVIPALEPLAVLRPLMNIELAPVAQLQPLVIPPLGIVATQEGVHQ